MTTRDSQPSGASPAPLVRLLADADLTDARHSKWWLIGLDLAGPGRMAVLRDVSDIEAAIAASPLAEAFDMEPAQLLAALLAPVSFHPRHVEVSPRLSALAAATGLAPHDVVLCCLVARHVLSLTAAINGTSDE